MYVGYMRRVTLMAALTVILVIASILFPYFAVFLVVCLVCANYKKTGEYP